MKRGYSKIVIGIVFLALGGFSVAFAEQNLISAQYRGEAIRNLQTALVTNNPAFSTYTASQKSEFTGDLSKFRDIATADADKLTSQVDTASQEEIKNKYFFAVYSDSKQYIDAIINNPSSTADAKKTAQDISNILEPMIISAANAANVSATASTTTVLGEAVRTDASGAVKRIEDDSESCSLLSGNLLGCIDSLLAWVIKTFLVNLAVGVLYVVARILQFGVDKGIVEFASWARSDNLYALWALTRDLLSTISLVVGMYFAFLYVIGRGDSAKRFAPWILIFAITVNFSYPVSRAAIDLSNIMALSFYQAAIPEVTVTGSDKSVSPIAFEIVSAMGLVQGRAFLNSTGNDKSIASGITSTSTAFMLFVVIVYITYVLLQFTILLMARLLGLIGSIIISPLLFVDLVVPKLGEYASKFRKFFLNQLLLAPVFMLLLYLAMTIIDKTKDLRSTSTGGLSGSGDNIGIFFGLFFVAGVFHIMLKVTKSLSGELGGAITGAVNGAMSVVGVANPAGLAFKGAALAGRATLGAGGRMIAESKWANSGGWLGEKAGNIGKRMSTATYDFRGTQAFKSVAKAGGIEAQELGTPIESLEARETRKTKEAEEALKRYRNPNLRQEAGETAEAYESRVKKFGADAATRYLGRIDNTLGVKNKLGAADALGLVSLRGKTADEFRRNDERRTRKENEQETRQTLMKELEGLDPTLSATALKDKIDKLKETAKGVDDKTLKWFEGLSQNKARDLLIKELDEANTQDPAAYKAKVTELKEKADAIDPKLIKVLEDASEEKVRKMLERELITQNPQGDQAITSFMTYAGGFTQNGVTLRVLEETAKKREVDQLKTNEELAQRRGQNPGSSGNVNGTPSPVPPTNPSPQNNNTAANMSTINSADTAALIGSLNIADMLKASLQAQENTSRSSGAASAIPNPTVQAQPNQAQPVQQQQSATA